MNATERLLEAFFTAPVTGHHAFLARMREAIDRMVGRNEKSVVWLSSPGGINSAVADVYRAQGFEVHCLEDHPCLFKASPSGSPTSATQAASEKPVVYLESPDGLNSAVADGFRDRGFEVRYLRGHGCSRKASLSEMQAAASPVGRETHDVSSKSPAQSETPAPSAGPDPGAKTNDPAERWAGDPSQRVAMTGPVETTGGALSGISCGVTLHIGTLNVNF